MKNKKAKLIIVLLLSLGLGLYAQQAVVSSGGVATGSGGSVSFSIGQVVYTTASGTNGTVSQGVQQTYDFCVCGVSANGTECINLKYSVYPNPTIDNLTLSVGNYKTENLLYQLFDINDKLLESGKIESNLSSIFMRNFASATYFLKIIENNQVIKTFKIIKKS